MRERSFERILRSPADERGSGEEPLGLEIKTLPEIVQVLEHYKFFVPKGEIKIEIIGLIGKIKKYQACVDAARAKGDEKGALVALRRKAVRIRAQSLMIKDQLREYNLHIEWNLKIDIELGNIFEELFEPVWRSFVDDIKHIEGLAQWWEAQDQVKRAINSHIGNIRTDVLPLERRALLSRLQKVLNDNDVLWEVVENCVLGAEPYLVDGKPRIQEKMDSLTQVIPTYKRTFRELKEACADLSDQYKHNPIEPSDPPAAESPFTLAYSIHDVLVALRRDIYDLPEEDPQKVTPLKLLSKSPKNGPVHQFKQRLDLLHRELRGLPADEERREGGEVIPE